MIINVTFDCECGGSIDRNFSVADSDIAGSNSEMDHYERMVCDGCTQPYEAFVSQKKGCLNVQVANSFNFGWERVDSDSLSYNNHTIMNRLESNDELAWVIQSTVQLENFQLIMTDVVKLLKSGIVIPNMSTLYNMAYAQVVTAVEAYLSGIFIHTVVNSPALLRKLVETDHELAKRPLVLKDIFTQWEGLQVDVANYLNDLIFHKLEKIKPMYKSVLGIEFGDVSWLFKAVVLRHDCVHRNGVDKSGNPTRITHSEVEDLIRKCASLLARIDQEAGSLVAELVNQDRAGARNLRSDPA